MCNNTLLTEENEKLKMQIQDLNQKLRILRNSQKMIENNFQRVKNENNKLKEFYSNTSRKNKNYELSKSFCSGNTAFNFHTNIYDDKMALHSLDSSFDPEKKTWKNYLKEMDKKLYGLDICNKKGTHPNMNRKNSE